MKAGQVTASTTVRLILDPEEQFKAPVERGRRNRWAMVDTITVTIDTLGHRTVTGRGRKINPNGSLSSLRAHIISLAFEDLTPAMLHVVEDEHRIATAALADLALLPTASHACDTTTTKGRNQ